MGKTSRKIYAAFVFTIAPIDGGPKLPKNRRQVASVRIRAPLKRRGGAAFNEDSALKREAAGKQKKLLIRALFVDFHFKLYYCSLMRRRRRLEPKRTKITQMAAAGNYHLAKEASMLTLLWMQDP